MTNPFGKLRINRSFLSFLILVLTSAIIFYLFPIVPKFLAVDEVEFAKLALSLENRPFLAYSTLATGHSTFYFYILLLSIKIFGITPFALRIVSAISGILCGILFFKIIELVSKKFAVAFISALIFITSRWFFGFARFSFEPTFLLFLELTSFYFLLLFMKNQKHRLVLLIMSGLFAGFAFDSYTPGRIFFLIPLVYIFLKARKNILYFLIPFILIIAPLQTYLFTHQDIRVNQLFFLSNNRLSIPTKVDYLGQNVTKTLSMFFIHGDPNGKHNYPFKPAINPILGILFIAGIMISIKNFRKKENKLFISYLFISIIPTLLVYPWENPSMLRTYTALPAIAYFASLPLVSILGFRKSIMKKVFLITFAILVLISSIYELRTYFMYQTTVFPHSFEIKRPLKDVIRCNNVLECKD